MDVGGANQKTIINQMMLKYRPIAPKPVAGEAVSGDLLTEDKKANVTNGKSKRKYVRIRKNNRCKREKIIKTTDEKNERLKKKTVVTLQLLPENPMNWNKSEIDLTVPIWFNIENPLNNGHVAIYSPSDRAVTRPPERISESCVTVECVTDTCTAVEGFRSLERDTCPCFVSDSTYRVKWVNEAYRRMVVGPQEGGDSPPEVVVRLVVKQELPAESTTFSCRVSVMYMQRKQTMPCDVWRIDFVGLAWRLDVKAALSLGR